MLVVLVAFKNRAYAQIALSHYFYEEPMPKHANEGAYLYKSAHSTQKKHSAENALKDFKNISNFKLEIQFEFAKIIESID